ncbi:unnamed protein product, partial [Pylaiella littoralis]
ADEEEEEEEEDSDDAENQRKKQPVSASRGEESEEDDDCMSVQDSDDEEETDEAAVQYMRGAFEDVPNAGKVNELAQNIANHIEDGLRGDTDRAVSVVLERGDALFNGRL